MLEKYSLHNLPEGIGIVVVLFLTVFLGQITKITFNWVIKRAKKLPENDTTALIFAKRCIVIIIYFLEQFFNFYARCLFAVLPPESIYCSR